MIRFILCFITLGLFSFSAHAYYSVMDTGEIMDPGRYKVTPEIQFLTEGGGANLGANFDMGLNDETGLRGQVGFGDTQFFAAGFFKYMPFPDVDKQPAIGFNAGLVYARDAGDADYTLRVEPLVSKKFTPDFGAITPYASIPFGWQHRSADKYAGDKDNLTLQIAIGTQVDLKTLPNWGLMAELGFDINKTFGYVSFGAAYYFGAEPVSKPAAAPTEDDE